MFDGEMQRDWAKKIEKKIIKIFQKGEMIIGDKYQLTKKKRMKNENQLLEDKSKSHIMW